MSSKTPLNLNRATVLLMVFGISAIFLSMIQGFLITLLLGALFSALMYPLYDRFCRWFRGRKGLASAATLLVFVFIILIPLTGVLVIVVEQALNASENVRPWIQENLQDPEAYVVNTLGDFPVVRTVFPDKAALEENIHNLITNLTTFVADGLSAATTGTVQFVFLAFIMLFAMYYFIIYGQSYLQYMLYYLPLDNKEEKMLLDRFTTVTRATLKGSLVIGIVQGTIGGVAMALCGIDNTVFWGLIMAVMSIIPALGPAIVWIPASVILFFGGNYAAGIALALVGAVIIGNIDNILRPILIGKDTKMPDLLILLTTLGGLAMFGAAGIIIGPIVGALFMTMWEIYGQTFKESLYKVTIFDAIPGEVAVADAEGVKSAEEEDLEENN